MQIKIKLFAALKEKTGTEEIRMDWTEGLRCQEVLSFFEQTFRDLTPLLKCSLIAVNGKYADPDWILYPEDEVALLPPVSGG